MARGLSYFRTLLCALGASLCGVAVAPAQSGIVGWGAHRFDSHWNSETFVGISAGGYDTAAFRSNGTVTAWGKSLYNQCYPPALPSGLAYVGMSFSGDSWSYPNAEGHALGLRSNGTLVAWGGNSLGQCNVPSLPSGVTFTSAWAGTLFSVASKSDGTLAAWGLNGNGQLNVPAPPAGQSFVRAVAGDAHALGLLGNGNILAWGANWQGCCNVPALPSGLLYLDITAGYSFSAALRSDGMVIAWGSNGFGECNVPPLPSGLSYTQVRSGRSHVLALRSDGALIAWGNNSEHECDVPVPPPGTSYVQIAAGSMHSAALRSDGRVVCWGDNRKLQCNSGALPPGVSYTKFSCSSYSNAGISSGAADSFVLALRSDGAIDVLGDFMAAPAPPPGLAYVDVAAGWIHGLALLSDGTVTGWGSCNYGSCSIPALPAGMRYVGIAASGGYHYDTCGFGYEWMYARSFLLRSDGALITLGDSSLGQLALPAPPAGVSYVEIAANGRGSVGRRSDGLAAVCGNIANVPVLPTGISWLGFAAAGGTYWESDCLPPSYFSPYHVLGLRSDGQVSAWGNNLNGETNVPALPPGLAYTQVANTDGFSLARRSDGSALGWGWNGQHNCEVPVLPAGEVYQDITCGTFGCIARYGPAPACGTISRTCAPSRPNSASAAGATLDVSGCAGISANSLALNVSGLPPSTLGMLLYGSRLQQIPFGNGWSCLAGSVQRVLPAIASSTSGSVSFPVDLTQYPFSGSSNPILPSSGWFFQYWYRDPLASPATFNTSDALHVFFAP
jgi:alpha-tubulin suppressor-like RCC1 family protein